MLQFYFNPVSVNARRVWIALLEKQLPFEPILLHLDDDQLSEAFTAVNPLQRVPVLVDAGIRVIESLAILDYLEAKYPTPALLPTQPQEIATVRMVAMVMVTDLQPIMVLLMRPLVNLEVDPQKLEMAKARVETILGFCETLLGEQNYFAGDQFTLADIVAGTLIPSLPLFGLALAPYPHLQAWSERLAMRPSWQQTTPEPSIIEAALPNMRKILERRS
jgi:glutathione S-transferase